MKIFRKKVNFFQLLSTQCEIMRRGIDALYKYCTSVGQPDHESYGDMVIAIEDEGDMARRSSPCSMKTDAFKSPFSIISAKSAASQFATGPEDSSSPACRRTKSPVPTGKDTVSPIVVVTGACRLE